MSDNACIHCGADCGVHPIVWEEKKFCCHGCQTVYRILHENDLKQYYEIQPMAGVKIAEGQPLKKFAFLDNQEIASQLLTFNDGKTARVNFFIPAIHCASCIWLLEHLESLNPGIIFSSVNFPRKEVAISFRPEQISLRQLAELLAAIHYVPELNLSHLAEPAKIKTNKSLLLKFGIAAFSFLNIMMYSFSEYVPGGHLLEENFKHTFGILSFILILPVVFYSASDYYLGAWKGLKHGVISLDVPITLGIIALFLQSSWEVFNGHGIGYMDSLAGLLFFLLIGKWYQGKTYEALSFERDYRSYFPVAATRIENETEVQVPISSLKKGDIIRIHSQELVPADATLIAGNGNIDYSFVTGESIPVARGKSDFIYAGGRQVGSSIDLMVEKAVDQSYLTQLWNQSGQKDESSLLNTHINRISKYFTIIVLLIAFSAFGWWLTIDAGKAVYILASVLIVACPCALALTVPFTFGSTLRVFGRKGFYLKKTDVVEDIYKTDAIVFDKTGTLTLNLSVNVEFAGETPDSLTRSVIYSVTKQSTHPLSQAIANNLKDSSLLPVERYEELPGQGILAEVNGKKIAIGSAPFVIGVDEQLAADETRVYVSIGKEMKGYFRFSNVYRPGLQEVVKELGKHYELHLISGDNNAEEDNLRAIFGERTAMLFKQSPTDKRAYILNLKAQGKRVAMIGDGLNDAGALKESNTGISIAEDVFSFSPACDAILDAGMFNKLHKFLRFTSKSFLVIRLSFVISLFYNLIGLSFAVTGHLSPIVAAILMPLSSVSVVAFDTFSIMWLSRRHLQ
ncbi:MAG TPA: heavy metal translocating P-type ATPase metal-binding domain-containing protein [Bacteroidales bacterium]|nr:heavy metal translocating P-type ATPase metal-binding domain-containing protein [Bacteroidales bacterium]